MTETLIDTKTTITIEDRAGLKALPVGALFVDIDGDTWEKRAKGDYRSVDWGMRGQGAV